MSVADICAFAAVFLERMCFSLHVERTDLAFVY
jgi:hypothetical protein